MLSCSRSEFGFRGATPKRKRPSKCEDWEHHLEVDFKVVKEYWKNRNDFFSIKIIFADQATHNFVDSQSFALLWFKVASLEKMPGRIVIKAKKGEIAHLGWEF